MLCVSHGTNCISHTYSSAIRADVSPGVDCACVMLAESCVQVHNSSIRRPELVNERIASQESTRNCSLQRLHSLCTDKSSLAH